MMKQLTRLQIGLVIILTLLIGSQIGRAQETLGEVVRLDPRFDKLVAADAQIEIIAKGFAWSEGPVFRKDDTGGYLLFSDIPRNSVFKWKEGQGISLYLNPSGYTGNTFYGAEPGSNGLLLDPQGRLVSCEHGDRRVSVLTEGGGKRTIVDNFEGKRLNSPNDGTYKTNGDLYFTDPPYGLPDWDKDPRIELDFFGVYRYSTDGKLTVLSKEMTRPNGIAFSHDEKTLYVAQSDPAAAIWRAFPVKSDGTLGASRVFYDVTDLVKKKLPGLPDGLKVDGQGNIFATGPGGVFVFDPDGTLVGRLDTGEKTGNCCWGNDGTVLYICADNFICRVRTKTKGARW